MSERKRNDNNTIGIINLRVGKKMKHHHAATDVAADAFALKALRQFIPSCRYFIFFFQFFLATMFVSERAHRLKYKSTQS